MQVELLVTLKSGKTTWKKGLILDDEEAPFPEGISRELNAETGNLRVIKADTKKPNADNDGKTTKADIFKMNKHDLAVFLGDETLVEIEKRQKLMQMAMEKLDDAS